MAMKINSTPIDFDALQDSAFVTAADLVAYFGVSRKTIQRWTDGGQLPQAYQLGANTLRWKVGEVRAAIAQKAA